MGRKDEDAFLATEAQAADGNAITAEADDEGFARTAPAGGATPALEAGTSVGRYVLEDKLGEGGMGVVYAAHDPDLDRRVALKFLRAVDDPSSEREQRLRREAQTMARLDHPNVASVHDVGTYQGRLFVAMEYVAGSDLRAWLSDDARTWREITAMFVQAGRGLAAAHQADVIHRDFKPDNVLVNADGVAKVTDFGLARAVGADAIGDELSADLDLTQTGSLLGTPLYMAPEQHRRERVGSFADQFAFAVSLYEALYGQWPFPGTTYAELADNVCHGRVRDVPSESEVPAWIRDVILRALATDPADRFASMAELVDTLALDPGVARRRRVRTAAIAVGFAALAAVAVFGLTRRAAAPGPQCDVSADEAAAALWNDGERAAVRSAFDETRHPNAGEIFERLDARLDGFRRAWRDARADACHDTHVRGEQSPELLDLRMACLDRLAGEARALVAVLASTTEVATVTKAIDAAAALPSVAQCDDRDALSAAVPPPSDPEARRRVAKIRAELDELQALRRVGSYEDAMPRVAGLYERVAELDHPPLTADYHLLAGALQGDVGDYGAAAVSLEEAAVAASAARRDDLTARAWSDLVHVLQRGARLEQAEAMTTVARAGVARVGSNPELEGRCSRDGSPRRRATSSAPPRSSARSRERTIQTTRMRSPISAPSSPTRERTTRPRATTSARSRSAQRPSAPTTRRSPTRTTTSARSPTRRAATTRRSLTTGAPWRFASARSAASTTRSPRPSTRWRCRGSTSAIARAPATSTSARWRSSARSSATATPTSPCPTTTWVISSAR